jgi:hypothetical protein
MHGSLYTICLIWLSLSLSLAFICLVKCVFIYRTGTLCSMWLQGKGEWEWQCYCWSMTVLWWILRTVLVGHHCMMHVLESDLVCLFNWLIEEPMWMQKQRYIYILFFSGFARAMFSACFCLPAYVCSTISIVTLQFFSYTTHPSFSHPFLILSLSLSYYTNSTSLRTCEGWHDSTTLCRICGSDFNDQDSCR